MMLTRKYLEVLKYIYQAEGEVYMSRIYKDLGGDVSQIYKIVDYFKEREIIKSVQLSKHTINLVMTEKGNVFAKEVIHFIEIWDSEN